MRFIKATTTEGQTEYFNLEKVLTLVPQNNDTVKIFMGAGLFWRVERDSISVMDLSDNELTNILRGEE